MITSQFPSRFPLCCVGYAFRHTFSVMLRRSRFP